jgi:hypothetical protein
VFQAAGAAGFWGNWLVRGVTVAVVVVIVLAVGRRVWTLATHGASRGATSARKRWSSWWRRHRFRRISKLRSRVVDRAQALELNLPLTHSGHNPTVVKYSGRPPEQYFFGSFERYKRDMVLSPSVSHHANRPKTVSEWTRKELRDWLHKHPARD